MLILCIIIVLLTLIISFLLFAKIKIFFEYKKYPGEKLYKEIKVSVGFIALDKFIQKLFQGEPKPGKTKSKEKKNLLSEIKTYTELFKIVKKVYSKNRWRIRKVLKADNIDFHLKFGLGDAASTGVMTGAVWSLLYSFLAFLCQIGTVKKHYFEVVPVYTESGFIFKASAKVSARVISAFSIVLRLYFTYRKLRKETKKHSNQG
ncbi:MAG: DUF2953 domain-containing protein [Clostridia bacterium]|nr:DUF2953 domain-containing protein [Clostridia bacterium]